MTIDLEAIKARLAAATPSPWQAPGTWLATGAPAPVVGGPCADAGYNVRVADCATTWRTQEECMANAMLIAHAPDDIAALIAEIARLQEALTFAQDQLAVLTSPPNIVKGFAELRAIVGGAFDGVDAAAYERSLRDDEEE